MDLNGSFFFVSFGSFRLGENIFARSVNTPRYVSLSLSLSLSLSPFSVDFLVPIFGRWTNPQSQPVVVAAAATPPAPGRAPHVLGVDDVHVHRR